MCIHKHRLYINSVAAVVVRCVCVCVFVSILAPKAKKNLFTRIRYCLDFLVGSVDWLLLWHRYDARRTCRTLSVLAVET